MSVLSGRLINLRPVEASDAEALHGMLNNPRLSGRRLIPEGFSDELPLSTVDISEIIDRWTQKRKADPHYVLTRLGEGKDAEQIVGHAVMGWGWDPITPWASVVVDPDQWRNGFGSEALQLLLGYLFRSTPAHNVAAWINDWDDAAIAFAKTHGFRKTGRVRHVGLRNGAPFDQITYDLLRPEWIALAEQRGDRDMGQHRDQHSSRAGHTDEDHEQESIDAS